MSQGGAIAIEYIRRHPERVSHLVLVGAYGRGALKREPTPLQRLEAETLVNMIRVGWGSDNAAFREVFTNRFIPGGTLTQHRWWTDLQRFTASAEGAARTLEEFQQVDVMEIAAGLRLPTLVMHCRDDIAVPFDEGRRLAAAIPGARFVELPGRDSMGWVGDMDSLLDETEEFLTGRRGQRAAESVLGTVLFTDICGSTQIAAQLSDRRWRDLLAEHHEKVGAEIEHAGGEVIKTFGDGVLATFDSAARALRAAPAAIDAVARLGLQLRAGAHTGEIELLGDDVGGLAVHIGARVAANAQPGEVWVTGTIKDILIASGLRFESRGTHDLKGVPGEWPLYALNGG
jgi:class 3 adenylate cyclase